MIGLLQLAIKYNMTFTMVFRCKAALKSGRRSEKYFINTFGKDFLQDLKNLS